MQHPQIAALSTVQRLQLIRQMRARLKREPKNFELWCNVGVLYAAEEQWEEAKKHYRKALSIKRNDEQILARVLEAYTVTRDFLNARKVARKLVEIAPSNPKYLIKYSETLSQLGKTEKAIELLERADKLSEGDPEILNIFADTLKSAGQIEKANAVYERLRTVSPLHPDALLGYCYNKKFNLEEAQAIEPDLLAASQKAAENNDAPGESFTMYSAGKVFEDCGQYDKAFQYFQKANDIRKNEKAREAFAEIDNVLKAFDRQFFAEREDFGIETDKPIFVLGMPRSGTTLTESLLGSHSEITAADEQSVIGGIAKDLGIARLDNAGFQKRLRQITSKNSRELAEYYLNSTKGVSGKTKHFTDKMPHNFIRIGIIQLLFPNSKVIHVQRHPLDNCVSLFTNSMRPFHNSYKTDLNKLGLYYLQYIKLMRHYDEALPNKILTVQYEDLVANTELVSRNMINHIGLDWEEGVLDRERSQKSVKTLSAWQVRQPVYQSSAGRWRNYKRHLGPLIDILGDEAAAYETKLAELSNGQQG